ncbi:MAG: ABC transporter permease subunit [Bacilli bacterium]|nr:ABC transporter permease subunit [Bacilli bacterium]MDY4052940.1 ABC transporter permease subunit [Bacilli bacterium]
MNFNDISKLFIETILMTVIATGCTYIIGIPLGLILNITSSKGICQNRIVNILLSTIVNILRSIPCLIVVVLMMPMVRSIFGVGTGRWYTILIPLIFTSIGFVSRMVEQSLRDVDYGKIEAVKSLGATNFQIITKVLLPEARASLIGGVAVVMVSIIGYTSFAYNIGAGGLIAGLWQFYAKNPGNYLKEPIFWILIIIIVILVWLIQEFGLFISKKLDKRRG